MAASPRPSSPRRGDEDPTAAPLPPNLPSRLSPPLLTEQGRD
jgi:hypothetical protein